MTRPHVIIIGGGLAGLSAAIRAMDGAAQVTLLESRARLGGATWSTRHEGLTIDNGQHVFLRCCTAYREFLDRLGVADRVTLQERLDVPIVGPTGAVAALRRHPLPLPLHLAPSLLRFRHLRFGERIRAALTARRLGELDLADPVLDESSFGAWLLAQGESATSVDNFWDLLIRPTLNLPARDASLALAAKVFQTGLLTRADGADVGYANVPLSAVHAEPAQAILERGGAVVRMRTRVRQIRPEADGIGVVTQGGDRLVGDAVILAVDHEAVADLIPAEAGIAPAQLRRLGSSPIMNLHVVFDRRITDLPFVATVGMRLQWVFDRTAAAGLDHGQYLAVSLSAADEYVGCSVDEMRSLFVPEFAILFPRARVAEIERFFVTREPSATFLQRPGTLKDRPGAMTDLPGFFLAGAWTDTGWPATMESAVLSGNAAAQAAAGHLRTRSDAYARSA